MTHSSKCPLKTIKSAAPKLPHRTPSSLHLQKRGLSSLSKNIFLLNTSTQTVIFQNQHQKPLILPLMISSFKLIVSPSTIRESSSLSLRITAAGFMVVQNKNTGPPSLILAAPKTNFITQFYKTPPTSLVSVNYFLHVDSILSLFLVAILQLKQLLLRQKIVIFARQIIYIKNLPLYHKTSSLLLKSTKSIAQFKLVASSLVKSRAITTSQKSNTQKGSQISPEAIFLQLSFNSCLLILASRPIWVYFEAFCSISAVIRRVYSGTLSFTDTSTCKPSCWRFS